MSDTHIPSDEQTIEAPTCMLRWFRPAPNPFTGESEEPRLQQMFQIRRGKTGGVFWNYEEWRDIPEANFYD